MINCKMVDIVLNQGNINTLMNAEGLDSATKLAVVRFVKACNNELEQYQDVLKEKQKECTEGEVIAQNKLEAAMQPALGANVELQVPKIPMSGVIEVLKPALLVALDKFIEDDMEVSSE